MESERTNEVGTNLIVRLLRGERVRDLCSLVYVTLA
jgi:hypothetical protein